MFSLAFFLCISISPITLTFLPDIIRQKRLNPFIPYPHVMLITSLITIPSPSLVCYIEGATIHSLPLHNRWDVRCSFLLHYSCASLYSCCWRRSSTGNIKCWFRSPVLLRWACYFRCWSNFIWAVFWWRHSWFTLSSEISIFWKVINWSWAWRYYSVHRS